MATYFRSDKNCVSLSASCDVLKRPPLGVGDRVVWLGKEKPEPGTVRWIGVLPNVCPDGWSAGIELDNPQGDIDGRWGGQELFKCQAYHGIVIDVKGLIKETDFLGKDSHHEINSANLFVNVAKDTDKVSIIKNKSLTSNDVLSITTSVASTSRSSDTDDILGGIITTHSTPASCMGSFDRRVYARMFAECEVEKWYEALNYQCPGEVLPESNNERCRNARSKGKKTNTIDGSGQISLRPPKKERGGIFKFFRWLSGRSSSRKNGVKHRRDCTPQFPELRVSHRSKSLDSVTSLSRSFHYIPVGSLRSEKLHDSSKRDSVSSSVTSTLNNNIELKLTSKDECERGKRQRSVVGNANVYSSMDNSPCSSSSRNASKKKRKAPLPPSNNSPRQHWVKVLPSGKDNKKEKRPSDGEISSLKQGKSPASSNRKNKRHAPAPPPLNNREESLSSTENDTQPIVNNKEMENEKGKNKNEELEKEKSSLRPEKSSLGPEKSILEHEKSSLGPEKSSVGSEKSSLGPEKSSLGPEKSSLGLEKLSLGPEKSSLEHEESSLGPEKSNLDIEKSNLEAEKSNVGGERPNLEKEKMNVGLEKSNIEAEKLNCEVEQSNLSDKPSTFGTEESNSGRQKLKLELETSKFRTETTVKNEVRNQNSDVENVIEETKPKDVEVDENLSAENVEILENGAVGPAVEEKDEVPSTSEVSKPVEETQLNNLSENKTGLATKLNVQMNLQALQELVESLVFQYCETNIKVEDTKVPEKTEENPRKTHHEVITPVLESPEYENCVVEKFRDEENKEDEDLASKLMQRWQLRMREELVNLNLNSEYKNEKESKGNSNLEKHKFRSGSYEPVGNHPRRRNQQQQRRQSVDDVSRMRTSFDRKPPSGRNRMSSASNVTDEEADKVEVEEDEDGVGDPFSFWRDLDAKESKKNSKVIRRLSVNGQRQMMPQNDHDHGQQQAPITAYTNYTYSSIYRHLNWPSTSSQSQQYLAYQNYYPLMMSNYDQTALDAHSNKPLRNRNYLPNVNDDLQEPNSSWRWENRGQSVKMLKSSREEYEKNNTEGDIETVTVNKLLNELELAICHGNLDEAAARARDLAQLKIQCSIIRNRKAGKDVISQNNLNHYNNLIIVNMFVEDKISHFGPIPIKVFPSMTIGQLKLKMFKEFEFPVYVQRWILGQRLALDDNIKLSSFGVVSDGFPVYLYLLTVGVDELMERRKENRALSSPENSKSRDKTKGVNKTKKEKKTVAVRTRATPTTEVIHKGQQNGDAEIGWPCAKCTLINTPTHSECVMCGSGRPPDYVVPPQLIVNNKNSVKTPMTTTTTKKKEQPPLSPEDEEMRRLTNWQQYLSLDDQDLIHNVESFECGICLVEVEAGSGVQLRDCLHLFCADCLRNVVSHTEEASVRCPYRDQEYSCESILQEREIRALVPPDVFERYLRRSIATAESQAPNSFHCKTPDCPGWCLYADNANEFLCPNCGKLNCITCRVIHQGLNCKQYQDELVVKARTDDDAKKTKDAIDEMVKKGDAMKCPSCEVIVMKKWGCDWIVCSICKVEICWVTKGPRWGPKGRGDVSGGCKCGINGVRCHPKCNYCH